MGLHEVAAAMDEFRIRHVRRRPSDGESCRRQHGGPDSSPCRGEGGERFQGHARDAGGHRYELAHNGYGVCNFGLHPTYVERDSGCTEEQALD